MPANVCPYCQYELDACSDPINLNSPSPGDFSVCIKCGGFLQFKTDLTVQAAELSTLFTLSIKQPNEYKTLLQMSQIAKDIQERDRP